MFQPLRRTCFSIIVLSILFAACTPERTRKPGDTNYPSTEQKTIPAKGTPDPNANAEVVGVNDGDTITVRMIDTGRQERVRLATIDAPEMNQPYGKAAKKSLSDLVFGKKIRLEIMDRDQYGRVVGEVFADGLNVNIEQIRKGFAWHYKEYQRQQTEEQKQVYSAAEETARQMRVGLWRDQNPEPPWLFRKSAER
jgi:endonuclease YncB( thermonuclease family)